MKTSPLSTMCKRAMRQLALFTGAGCIRMAAALAAGPGQKAAPLPPLSPPDADATRMQDIHDIKPVLDIGFNRQWLYWALAAAVVAILAAAAWRLWRRRKSKPASEKAAPPVAADSEAYSMLDALAAGGDSDIRRFYFSLSAILRRYIERRYGVPAVEMTTEELLPAVDRLALTSDLAVPLKAFCRDADPVKFAGASVARERMAGDLAFVRDFVRRTTPPETIADESETTENQPLVSQNKDNPAALVEHHKVTKETH